MLYREAGQFKIDYGSDQAIFPIRQDRIGFAVLMALAFVVIPLVLSDYWFTAILIPFLVFALAAIGLNILTGYAGQLSLGTAAFMAVGAFSAYNLVLRASWIPEIVSFALAGLCAAVVGIVFGLPSVRIKGFYLAVATLAAQFFVVWALQKFPWFTNHSASGVIDTQPVTFLGMAMDTPRRNYLFVLSVVALMALLAKNLVRSNIGRQWMAVRDMDVAAEVIGIPLMRTKLLAFAVSSFYAGVAGALYAFCYLGNVLPEAFSLDMSLLVLFMIIIGGTGSIMGSFIGSAFITLLPILLSVAIPPFAALLHLSFYEASLTYIEYMIFGAFIILFLIVEPRGLARLWQIGKEKLRIWPFPH